MPQPIRHGGRRAARTSLNSDTFRPRRARPILPTGTLAFDNLPTDVSFTSASGDFLTGGVPEASTWAMSLIGFAGLGCAGLARRRARTFVVVTGARL
jgi:hypothetical protein